MLLSTGELVRVGIEGCGSNLGAEVKLMTQRKVDFFGLIEKEDAALKSDLLTSIVTSRMDEDEERKQTRLKKLLVILNLLVTFIYFGAIFGWG